MAAAAEEVKFSLEVMINKEKTKVLFADVDSDFADVLLSFLTLPLGTMLKLLQKHFGDQALLFGSLNTLYDGLANLDNVHFWTEEGKLMLLNPTSSFEAECCKLKLHVDDIEPTKYFTCEYLHSVISLYYDAARCHHCGKKMIREMDKSQILNQNNDDDGVFAIKTVSFLISDDLKMVPNIAGSFIQTLINFGIVDTDGAEQRTVTIGFKEILDLLKLSLFSSTPLTDLILNKTQKAPTIRFEPGQHIKKEETSDSKKTVLKVIVQKSTNRFLFAHAKDDFVDFLFSFLTIPLGGVEWLLSGNTSFRNIDNLFKSSGDLIEYLKTQATGNSVFNPMLAPKYLSKNQIFSLNEQRIPDLYYTYIGSNYFLSLSKSYYCTSPLNIIDPKGQESYVKGPRMYIVMDDLTVTPLCMSLNVSILNGMKIKVADVKELEIHIGQEEGLSILKASLTSTRALSNGLSSFLMK